MAAYDRWLNTERHRRRVKRANLGHIKHRSDNWYCTIEGCTWHWLDDDDNSTLAQVVNAATDHIDAAHRTNGNE